MFPPASDWLAARLPAEPSKPIRVAALVDLPRSAQAGGHVKCWERLAAAAAEMAEGDLALDLTVYFSGHGPDEVLAPNVRLRHLPPIFSTSLLKFLPYVPDHSDLAPYHPVLAQELGRYDLIHTTDSYFAFARTAERVARRRGIPLTTSLHTDTPAYARIFTRQTIEKLFARRSWLSRKLLEDWDTPERVGANMERRLERHVRQCAQVFVTRSEERFLARGVLGEGRVGVMRLGVDRAMFGPHRRDVAGVRRDYKIPEGRAIALFVGRVDAGKNAQILMEAASAAIASGAALHLIVAGLGPMADALAERLAGNVCLPGFVPPDELGRLCASVDFLALPSEVETYSLATLEAIASSCPALIARASGAAEVFGRTPAALTVDSGVANWAAAISDLAQDVGKRSAMRRAALAYSNRHLATWSTVINEDLAPRWKAALSQTVGAAA